MNYDMKYLIDRYCKGLGVEIGPGESPYSKLQTVYVDKFCKSKGIDIVSADADNLPFNDDHFDFAISSHCLEHCPDTLKVLEEWMRVVRDNGVIFLVLPHGERTFDKGRELTALGHHIEDWRKKVNETDETHWEEFAKFSVPNYPHEWITEATKGDGSLKFDWIVENGHLHYHVWTQNEIVDILKYLGCFITVCIEELIERTDSFVVVARIKKY